MTTIKNTSLAKDDTRRRAFSPIQMDLLDRLSQEAETRTGDNPATLSDRPGTKSRLAA